MYDQSFLKNMRSFNIDDGINLLNSDGFITMSWGVEKVKKLLTADGTCRGMSFEVNGMKFKGTVVMSVNGLDYYEVRFFKGDELVHMLDDVFVGDFITLVDEFVEKQEEYVR